MSRMHSFARLGRRFRRSETGAATIDFLLILPVIFGMMCLAVETGVATTQAALLDRALDRTARSLRYGELADRSLAGIRANICANMAGMADCATKLKVQVVAIPRAMTNLPGSPTCADQGSAPRPATSLIAQNQNSFALLRVCIPVTVLGTDLARTPGTGTESAGTFDISSETIIAVTG